MGGVSKMIKGICKYCSQEKELINSHIIPKSLCLSDKMGPLVRIDAKSQKLDHNPIHQNGAKEPLLCKECDNSIGKLDNYASKVFKQIIPKHKLDLVNGYLMAKLLPDEVDYWTLKRFFISLLWRASISSSGARLGKYEDVALKMLKEELPDNPNFFVPLICLMDTKTPLDFSTGLFSHKTSGKHSYTIYFPHYKVIVIPCTEHSQDPKLMQICQASFNSEHIIVLKLSTPNLTDKQLLDLLKICQDKEL